MAQQTKAAPATAVPVVPVSVSIAAISDQLGLAAIALDSTVTGGVTPYTYSWTVNGATTGLSDATAADPTLTPTLAMAGLVTVVCTVTDAAGVTQTATRTFQLGDDDRWVKVWSVDLSALEANNWTAGGTTRTIEGVTFNIVNQGNLAAGSGPDGADGLNLSASGVHRMWYAGGTDPRGAVGVLGKIQDMFTAEGAGTYSSKSHEIAWQVSCYSAVPTTNAVYGVAICNGLWSTATTHFRAVVGENYSGIKGTATQCSNTAGAAVNVSPAPSSYPLGLALVRVGDTAWAVVDEVELGTPADYPTEFARGALSNGSTIAANVWTDATDRVGLCVTNDGTGTTTAIFAGMVLWVRPHA